MKVGGKAGISHGPEDPEKLVDEAGGGECFDEGVGSGEGEREAFEVIEMAAEGGGVVEEEGKEGYMAVEGVGVVTLCGGPGEEACGG